MTESKYVFNADDIFQEISDDPENINMTIPPEVCERMGWKEGDTIKISLEEEGVISLIKVENE